ncbi:transporter component [Methanococcus vannielii SB]|jgi:uncharacterized membrane protein YedE/YeeE|uniref:Transporter component n=1 Tax=Methanococcus vannielii (strain ATCC 35089 / DSM 1224 / JCM 13029 / OCM 148 / SB) TaxID=406327 RepID=A6UQI5_METVS|nr:YeeE/YedE thiosulfate transporter family protein [Methanococcus vannielii]ABR54757.1 transporter component [Methanococcus vannielii SB]
MDIYQYLPAIGTLVFGTLLGYLGQRSALCFCGGLRDFSLMKDTWLLKGLFGFIGGALIGSILFHIVGLLPLFPWILTKGVTAIPGGAAGGLGFMPNLVAALIGGFGVGFLSIIQGGCPFRNFIMAGEGNQTAIMYIIGLAVGAVIYHQWALSFIQSILA